MEEEKENLEKIKLYIDVREDKLKSYFGDKKNVIIQSLDIGDILFKKNNEIVLIIERKTIPDLSASIIDGRAQEQKMRLLGSDIDKSRIMYLIEGDISKPTTIKGGCNTLTGSLINTMFRDGISVYKTKDINETIFFIEKIFDKLYKDGNTFWNFGENQTISISKYSASLKTSKKANMTPKVWFHTQLTLIPQITGKIAEVITEKYPSVINLIKAYEEIEKDKRVLLLKDITYISDSTKSRKVGPSVSKKVYNFFYSITE